MPDVRGIVKVLTHLLAGNGLYEIPCGGKKKTFFVVQRRYGELMTGTIRLPPWSQISERTRSQKRESE